MSGPVAAIGLVILDCDGVLINSEVIGCRVDAEALSEAGIEITLDEILGRFAGTTSKAMLATLQAERGVRLPADFVPRLRARTDAVFERELMPMPGVHRLLDRLDLPRCVASSSTYRRLEKTLRLTGLYDRLAPHIFSAEAVAAGKPAPDLFLHAAARMGTPPAQCLVVEDSVNGVRAARAAGMRVVGFTGGSHCRADHARALEAEGAAPVVPDMAALAEIVAQHRD